MKKTAAESAPVKRSQLEILDIGLDNQTRAKSVELLSAILGDQHVLYIKTRNYHWNLTGHRFHTLHAFFEEQYKALEAAIDKTAERIRMLGLPSPGSMQELLELATLTEVPGQLISGDEAIKALRDDHETAARAIREAIEEMEEGSDAGTVDFITDLLQSHEEAAWMLRSFLE